MISSPGLPTKINKYSRFLSNPGYLTSCNKIKKCKKSIKLWEKDKNVHFGAPFGVFYTCR